MFSTKAKETVMRSMWKGTVSFGLVSIPVKLYAATEQHDVSFRQVRGSDGARIRYKRVAESDGEEVQYADIRKGYELPDGEMMIIEDKDLADLPLPSKRVVDVVEFVPLSEIDPIYFNKSYYLEPEKQGLKPYALLRDTLKNTRHGGRRQGGHLQPRAAGDAAGQRRRPGAGDDAVAG